MKRIALQSTGTWPASEYLPMGAFENEAAQECMLWQIETAGSWNTEISDIDGAFYVQLSGPSANENQFTKYLATGDCFCSVPCAVAVGVNFESAVQEMTQYRRTIRRKNAANERPAVIFNDYMNCLFGDPTTQKLLPLIDAAADAGCDIFCVDCGWYDDGPWWDGVGEWLPAKGRFPEGIAFVMNRIREKGMVPGLWLELEVMGIHCPLADKVPDEWFFQRSGHRVIDHGRFQLDFRNPGVRAHASDVIRRLVQDYGVGYIKNDYNINAGVGTEWMADSPGEGLLAHTRAYLAWLDEIFTTYPDLIIENCGSGGMRMEYSLLQRHSIQSVTDQTDYIKMAPIACNCMSALTPEQAAIWSYPLSEGDAEETIFNMVNAMLMRVHQSGHLAELSEPRLAIVQEGIAYHKRIAPQITHALPFWPIGLASMSSEFLSVGLDCGDTIHLAVWCCGNTGGYVDLPLRPMRGKSARVCDTFPSQETAHTNYQYFEDSKILRVYLAPKRRA